VNAAADLIYAIRRMGGRIFLERRGAAVMVRIEDDCERIPPSVKKKAILYLTYPLYRRRLLLIPE